jgi:hypothetical protein
MARLKAWPSPRPAGVYPVPFEIRTSTEPGARLERVLDKPGCKRRRKPNPPCPTPPRCRNRHHRAYVRPGRYYAQARTVPEAAQARAESVLATVPGRVLAAGPRGARPRGTRAARGSAANAQRRAELMNWWPELLKGLMPLFGVALGFALAQVSNWWVSQRRRRAHWAALRAELRFCHGLVNTYEKDRIAAPLYRLRRPHILDLSRRCSARPLSPKIKQWR